VCVCVCVCKELAIIALRASTQTGTGICTYVYIYVCINLYVVMCTYVFICVCIYLYVAHTNTTKQTHVDRNKKLNNQNNNTKRDHKAGAWPLQVRVQAREADQKNKIKN
jgi:Ca2+/Na+ antiporter